MSAIVLINPNSCKAMTQSALQAARRTAPELQFVGWTSTEGPPAIEGPEDGERAIPPMLTLVRSASDAGAAAIIIACFDDTGLDAANEIAECPVIGIGQSSYVLASLISGATAVITTVEAAVPVIQSNIDVGGYSRTVTHVSAAQVPVLTLEDDPDTAAEAFEHASEALPAGTMNLILGCAGAVNIADQMRARTDLRIIDGVTAAARLCRALVT